MGSFFILWFVGIIIYFVLKSLIKKGGPAPKPIRKKGKYTPEEFHNIYTEGLREYEQKSLSTPTRRHAKPEIDKFLNTKKKTTLIIFDLETNGLEEWRSVLSCTAIKYEINPNNYEMVEVDRFNRYYYPVEEFNPQAIAINGLTRDIIVEKRGNANYPAHFKNDGDFVNFCTGVIRFVAHNISFDMQFIPFLREKKNFCTMMTNMDIVAVEFLKWKNEWKWPKLSETAAYYGIPFQEKDLHSSISDAEITAKVFLRMIEAINLDIDSSSKENKMDITTVSQNNTGGSNETDYLKFQVDGPNIQNFTHVGMRVKLWIPKENPEKVFIFQGDGPDGRLGLVPSEYTNIIVSHLIKALDYDAEIVELDSRTCKINCGLISKEESEHRKGIEKGAKQIIIKTNALGKTNYEKTINLYREVMEILKEMDQQCEKFFSTWRKNKGFRLISCR